MARTRVARRDGRRHRGRKAATRWGLLGAAAATATTLTVSTAPAAGALDIEQQLLGAGPLVNLLPVLGLDSFTVPLGNLPVVGDTNLLLDVAPIAFDTQNIYNTVNTLPFQRRGGIFPPAVFDRVYATSGPVAGQFPAVIGSGIGSRNTVQAYRTQISSVRDGITPGGFTPYQPGADGLPNITSQGLLLVRNPYRPNGGIQARFAPLLNLFGVDTSMPAAGRYQSADEKIRLNTATIDLTWAYDPMADFPVTLNPFSLLNSLLAGLLLNLAGGVQLTGLTDTSGPVTTTDLGLNIASVLGIINRITGVATIDAGKAFYGTLLPNDLPILEPLRLPARLINLITGLDLPTPFADALQPALQILVNTGYPDVITPADAPDNPELWYSRTFLDSYTPTPFLSVRPLTFEEWLRVPGDVLRALVTGFTDVFFPSAPQVPPASATAAPVAIPQPAPEPVALVAREPVALVAREPVALVAREPVALVAPEPVASAPEQDTVMPVADETADLAPDPEQVTAMPVADETADLPDSEAVAGPGEGPAESSATAGSDAGADSGTRPATKASDGAAGTRAAVRGSND